MNKDKTTVFMMPNKREKSSMPVKGKEGKPVVKDKPVKKGDVKKTGQKKKINGPGGFPILGIGASAGGLETLETFFSNMPPESNMAFVIIQHLSPKHESIMASLLSRHTRMQVRQIKDGTRIEPNCVYLNPPNMNVAIIHRTLQLMAPVQGDGINLPIDFFFRTLSEDQGEKAICIILSGTASDGTLGIKEVKGKGGMVMVQDPSTAKYDGMPRSAVETGLVDFILPVEKMPAALIRYVKHPFIDSPGKTQPAEVQDQNQLQKVFSLVRTATGHDFSHYKQSTIQRRIERRLAIHQINRISDYILYLQKTPKEINALFKDMVIGVTNFFRDPEAFAVLEEQALPALLGEKKTDTPIRIWVAGCSTGEEAYSLGILVFEVMDKLNKYFSVQIFATDIDEEAIEVARRAIYPESIAADVSQDRLNRFFIKHGDVFKVKKQIRDMIVFSTQNVIKDPPFSRLDLVSCRNVMIYMETVLQKKMLPLFHYILNPGGILFLGTSESIGEHLDLFGPVNSKWKIFKRKEGRLGRIIDYPVDIHGAQSKIEAYGSQTGSGIAQIQALAERIMLDEYAPSGVLINQNHEILHFIGKTDRYLTPPTGRARFNILDMAREGLKYRLTSMFREAAAQKKEVLSKGVRVRYNGDFRMVDLTVKPLEDRGLFHGFMLVVFEDKTLPRPPDVTKPKAPKGKESAPALESLERELQSTREYLQATIEELETANEELKSSNEEMQSVNEELQSTNEELETSKEELQSTNEELSTVNAELQNKVDELSRAGNDMNNLLGATQIASIFLDTDLRITRYTPAAEQIIKLIPRDIGRSLSDLKTNFPDTDITGCAEHVLKTLNTVEMEILSKDHIWHAMKIMPYRTMDNVINGVVMTFVDINRVKQADNIRRLAAVLQDANDAVMVFDFTGKILIWNKGARVLYGWTEDEALQMNIHQIIPEDQLPQTQTMIEKLKQGEVIKSFKTLRRAKNGEIIKIWLTASVLKDEFGKPAEIAATERNLQWLNET